MTSKMYIKIIVHAKNENMSYSLMLIQTIFVGKQTLVFLLLRNTNVFKEYFNNGLFLTESFKRDISTTVMVVLGIL